MSGFYSRCPALPPRKLQRQADANAVQMTYLESESNFSKASKLKVPLGLSDYALDTGQETYNVEVFEGGLALLEEEIGARESARTIVLVHDNFATVKGSLDAQHVTLADLQADMELLIRQRDRAMRKLRTRRGQYDVLMAEADAYDEANRTRRLLIEDLESTVPTAVPGVKKTRRRRKAGSIASEVISEVAQEMRDSAGDEDDL